jgi:hypothetical protein
MTWITPVHQGCLRDDMLFPQQESWLGVRQPLLVYPQCYV